MATKLAGLDMQQRDSQIKEAERLTALVEDTISASAGEGYYDTRTTKLN